jgi:low molecular weight protein-tyrosine phosphatase
MADESSTAAARRLRHAPDWLLHPVRRRAARRALLARGRGRLRTVLVVCHGNICRSPLAAGLLADALGPGGTLVTSAGFVGPGRAAPAEACIAAAQLGVDLRSHRSQLLTPVLAREADLIVVMEPGQQRAVCQRFGRLPQDVIVLGDLDPQSLQTRAMQDPVDQPLEAFQASYDRIERCVRELVSTLRRRAA